MRFLAAGDTAFTVELSEVGSAGVSGAVLELYLRIVDAGLPGIIEVVPAIRSLTVHYEPNIACAADLHCLIRPLVRDALQGTTLDDDGEIDPVPALRRWLVPACYDAEVAVDVDAIAAAGGLAPWQVAALHACVSYRVVMVGFLPGQPYLGSLPPPLRLPRRQTPRTAVSAGSIAIAGAMCSIYPFQSPGGWHVIGRTPVRWFDPGRDEPALLAPGDEVRFRPIGMAELEALTEDTARGRWRLEPEKAAA